MTDVSSEFERKIVRQLANKRSRNEIIMTVCQEQGWQWPEAEAYIVSLEEEHAGDISRTQRRYFRWFSLGFVIAGIMTILAGLIITLSGLVIIILRIPIPYLGNALIFLAGLGLIVGGGIGWFQTSKEQVE